MRLSNNAQKKTNYTLLAFIFGCLIASAIVVPIMIINDGYFLYYGDFNVQQIPFYMLAHDAILEGNTAWSSITDLGSNFVGSYSFYVLSSPFFLVTLLFKSEMVPYLIGPLLILKFGCASMTACIYLRRYVADRKYAIIGGLLYAFSGFSIYNVFFFHFHEAIIIFPLLLAAVDEYMYTKRKGVVCLAVFASCCLNYYFFFGQVVFTAIYWLVKVISKSYKFSFKYFLLLFFECVLGVLMACAILLPSVFAIINNDRVDNIINGFDALVYDVPQRYLHILSSMFFPPDLPARPNFTPESNSKWASIALWIPLFGMTFVLGYMKNYLRSWPKRMIIILLTMAAIPILNSTFQALNDCYYARWFYMFTLMMILCTVISLDNIRNYNIKSSFVWSFVFTLAIAVGIGLMVEEKFSGAEKTVYGLGLEENPVRFWIYVGISVVSLLLLLFITVFARHKKRVFFTLITIVTCITIIGYSEYILMSGKQEADQTDEFTIKYALNQGEDINLKDIDDVRSDFYNSMDNIGMYWQIKNIQAFHSIVPASTMEFYNTLGSVRDVASRPETKFYGIRSMLSVKYLFDECDDGNDFENKFGSKMMPGYTYIDTQNGYDIYENDNYVPMGFMYDTFICEEEFKNLSSETNHLALMKAMVLSQQQMKEYKDITGYKDGMYLGLNEEFNEDNLQNVSYPEYKDFTSVTDDFYYSIEQFEIDCARAKTNTCDSFNYTNDGFEATITNEGDDNLLFFSVPYDEGFTAYVNGKETEIEKVNIGFMAVKIDGHKKSSIKFVYKTPGLRLGSTLAIIGFTVFIIYFIICKGFRAKKKYRRLYHIKKD